MRPVCLLVSAIVASALAGCATDKPQASDTPPDSTPAKVDFATQVKPILQERCVMCHNQTTLPTRHSFESRALVMKGDSKGPIIVPGKPESSRFIIAIVVPEVHETAMPPVSARITKAETETLKQWIREGAHWPSGRAGRIVPTMIPRE